MSCPYCHYITEGRFKGDTADDYKPLIFTEVPYEDSIIIDDNLKATMKTAMFLGVYVGHDCIELDVCNSQEHEVCYLKSEKINYCPMCGRKINAKESESNGDNKD